MILNNHGFRLLSVGTIALASAFTFPGAASAQLFFDWGGSEKKVNDSGRQPVRINTDAKPGEIIVSFTDRKLYLMTGPGQAVSYPVAIPREQDRWEGKTSVSQKRENPSWTPTPSMLKENPRLPRWVPGGHPMNPLGNRALYLGSSYYRIHGTDAPWTIGTAVSKGCIRMYNKDALDVYEQTKLGAKVLVTWNSYQSSPTTDDDEQAAASEQSAQTHRASVPAQPQHAQRAQNASATGEPRMAQSRYSDIYGTPEPKTPGRASTQAPSDAAATPRAPAKAAAVPKQTNEQSQTSRESRKASATGERTAAPASSEAANQPARPKVSEPKAKPASVETGALQERKAKPKPASAPAQEQVSAATAAQADAAAKALEAAERAAAAAERAAAAAERAERALAARSVSAAAPAATEPLVQAKPAVAQSTETAASTATAGGD